MTSIESAVTEALKDLEPRHGGMMVAQAETVSGRVFRRSAGWSLELCPGADSLHVQLIGSSVYRRADLDLFRYAGDERVTDEEMAAAALEDTRREQARREAEADAEFDRLFARLDEFEDAPEITFIAAE